MNDLHERVQYLEDLVHIMRQAIQEAVRHANNNQQDIAYMCEVYPRLLAALKLSRLKL